MSPSHTSSPETPRRALIYAAVPSLALVGWSTVVSLAICIGFTPRGNAAFLLGGITKSLAIIGGCGHVGLPHGIALADRRMTVTLLDIDSVAVGTVNAGRSPFHEDGAEDLLVRAVEAGRLSATLDPA